MTGHEKDKYRYRITVSGTGVEEYYEFDDPLPEDEVASIWYSDAQENLFGAIVREFRDDIEAEALFDYDDVPEDKKELQE